MLKERIIAATLAVCMATIGCNAAFAQDSGTCLSVDEEMRRTNSDGTKHYAITFTNNCGWAVDIHWRTRAR